MGSNLDEELELLTNALAEDTYEFIDLGCGSGESIGKCVKQFSALGGIGVDISDEKISRARDAGYTAFCADVTKARLPEKSVRFCTMLDFLEHLENQHEAELIIEQAKAIARDFLYIRHPSFENINYLKNLDLKITWTDWSEGEYFGHSNMMTLEDFDDVFRSLDLLEYVVVPQNQILDSSHQCVLPLSAPTNTTRYSETLHGHKPLKFFDRPLWSQFDIFVKLNPNLPHSDFAEVVKTCMIGRKLADLETAYTHQKKKRRDAEIAYASLKKKYSQCEDAYKNLKRKFTSD